MKTVTPEAASRYRENRRKRYAEDRTYRAAVLHRNRLRRAKNRDNINDAKRERWRTDLEYREKKLAQRRGRDQRADQLKIKYRISLKEYNEKKAAQGRLCRICGKRIDETLCVDHDHKTGLVRGLLCRKCNTGLGCFLDSPGLLKVAAVYLEEWHGH